MACRVLVVDDEPDKVADIEDGLKEKGYEVLSARNGKQAIEKLQKEKVDLMVLDLIMPDMKGQEVLHAVRASVNLNELVIFIFSSHPEGMRQVPEFEEDIFFLKDEAPETVVEKIHGVFTKKQGGKVSRGKTEYDASYDLIMRYMGIRNYVEYKEQRNSLEILIVDDEEMVRETISENLIKHKFKAWVPKTVESAWEILNMSDRERESIDIALIDLQMPGMTGDELVRKMKQSPDERINSIPVLIMTSLGQEDWDKGAGSLQHKAIEEGACIKISKDDALDEQKLLEAIERVLRKYLNWYKNERFDETEPHKE